MSLFRMFNGVTINLRRCSAIELKKETIKFYNPDKWSGGFLWQSSDTYWVSFPTKEEAKTEFDEINKFLQADMEKRISTSHHLVER